MEISTAHCLDVQEQYFKEPARIFRKTSEKSVITYHPFYPGLVIEYTVGEVYTDTQPSFYHVSYRLRLNGNKFGVSGLAFESDAENTYILTSLYSTSVHNPAQFNTFFKMSGRRASTNPGLGPFQNLTIMNSTTTSIIKGIAKEIDKQCSGYALSGEGNCLIIRNLMNLSPKSVTMAFDFPYLIVRQDLAEKYPLVDPNMLTGLIEKLKRYLE